MSEMAFQGKNAGMGLPRTQLMNEPTEAQIKKRHIEALIKLQRKRRKEVPLMTDEQQRRIVFDE